MEGFHLFQEKIKGEVNKTAASDPKILFIQTDSLTTSDISELVGSHCDAFNYNGIDRSIIPEFESDFVDFYQEPATYVNFRLEYVNSQNETQFYLEDFRDVMLNYNNDLESENRKTIIMFYD